MIDDVIYLDKNMHYHTLLGFCIVFFLHEKAATAGEVFKSCAICDDRKGVPGRELTQQYTDGCSGRDVQ